MKNETKSTDTFNRAVFEKAMCEKYRTSMVRYADGDEVGRYCDSVVDKEWATWVAATRAEWNRVRTDHNTPKVQPVAERNCDAFREQVIGALRVLDTAYVKADGGIAMVAANAEAHPAIREAWATVSSWLSVSSVRQIKGDLIDASSEGDERTVDAQALLSVIRLAVGEAVIENTPSLKQVAKAVRKAVYKEFKKSEVNISFDSASLETQLEAHGYVKCGKVKHEDAEAFNGSNGDPSVVITVPEMHDGNGGRAVTRFTGVIENEHSGERWLVNAKLDGMCTTPFVKEADVSRIPD